MSEEYILIGHPVSHSISPVIHHKAYEELGVDAHYSLADCPSADDVAAQVARLRSGELKGANITVPWKSAAFVHADEVHPTAQQVGVANVLSLNEHGKLVAYNTDATALASELLRVQKAAQEKVQPGSAEMSLAQGPFASRPGAVVIGNGGAARAAVVACRLAGIERIYVTARRFDPKVERALWPAGAEFENLGAQLVAWPAFTESEESQKCFANSHLLVQATSAGMKGKGGGQELSDALPWAAFQQPGAVYDLVYNPPLTEILIRAQSEGHEASAGLGMLVGQAADAVEIWMARKPTLEPLLAAANEALGL